MRALPNMTMVDLTPCSFCMTSGFISSSCMRTWRMSWRSRKLSSLKANS
jgi:hypothetical protein